MSCLISAERTVTLGFSAASYTVEESDENVTVCVFIELNRPLPVGLTLPVMVRTVDGSAQRELLNYMYFSQVQDFSNGPTLHKTLSIKWDIVVDGPYHSIK